MWIVLCPITSRVLLHAHCEVDGCLIHVEDEMLFLMTILDKGGRDNYVIHCPPLNFIRLAWTFMRAHLIDHLMGTHKALHNNALGNKVLGVELGGEHKCLHNNAEGVCSDPLLMLFRGIFEQGVF
jgi:hypothetical protein